MVLPLSHSCSYRYSDDEEDGDIWSVSSSEVSFSLHEKSPNATSNGAEDEGADEMRTTTTSAAPPRNIITMAMREAAASPFLDSMLDRVGSMFHQEDQTAYDLSLLMTGRADESTTSTTCTPFFMKERHASWREKICQWSYNVVDHFDFSREVVALSLNYFDRYMVSLDRKQQLTTTTTTTTTSPVISGQLALLTSLTTLHMAIKLHDTKKIRLKTLAHLSRGQFTARDIEQMEWTILTCLQWKLHPPTSYSFVHHFLLILWMEFMPTTTLAAPSHTLSALSRAKQQEQQNPQDRLRRELMELTRYLTELTVCDSYFCSVPASVVAVVSILYVLENNATSASIVCSALTPRARHLMVHRLFQLMIDHHGTSIMKDIQDARQRLEQVIKTAPAGALHLSPVPSKKEHPDEQLPKKQEVHYQKEVIASTRLDTCTTTTNTTAVGSTLKVANVVMSNSVGSIHHLRTNSIDSKGSASSCRSYRLLAATSPVVASTAVAAVTVGGHGRRMGAATHSPIVAAI